MTVVMRDLAIFFFLCYSEINQILYHGILMDFPVKQIKK